MNPKFRPYVKRLLIVSLAALIFVAIINESAHFLLKDKTDRTPETIEIVIPAGTAEKIANGEPPPVFPDEMVFVIGDTLTVKNEDRLDHELGPLYIPAGSSASLQMDDANKYTLGCTFTPAKYLNFDVRQRTTIVSRLQAFALATPPPAMFFFVYSLLVFPLDKKSHKATKAQRKNQDIPS